MDEVTRLAILFQNEQWRVDENGIKARRPAPTYEISASRLTESTRDTSYYDWPVHMAEKTWVQPEQFIEVCTQALQLLAGNYVPVADPTKLKASIAKAREQALRMASNSRFPM